MKKDNPDTRNFSTATPPAINAKPVLRKAKRVDSLASKVRSIANSLLKPKSFLGFLELTLFI